MALTRTECTSMGTRCLLSGRDERNLIDDLLRYVDTVVAKSVSRRFPPSKLASSADDPKTQDELRATSGLLSTRTVLNRRMTSCRSAYVSEIADVPIGPIGAPITIGSCNRGLISREIAGGSDSTDAISPRGSPSDAPSNAEVCRRRCVATSYDRAADAASPRFAVCS